MYPIANLNMHAGETLREAQRNCHAGVCIWLTFIYHFLLAMRICDHNAVM